jgi:hypothetical protein
MGCGVWVWLLNHCWIVIAGKRRAAQGRKRGTPSQQSLKLSRQERHGAFSWHQLIILGVRTSRKPIVLDFHILRSSPRVTII